MTDNKPKWILSGLIIGAALFVLFLCVLIASGAFREANDPEYIDDVVTTRPPDTEYLVGSEAIRVLYDSVTYEKADGSVFLTSDLILKRNEASGARPISLKYYLRLGDTVVKTGFADPDKYFINPDNDFGSEKGGTARINHSLTVDPALLESADQTISLTYEVTWEENNSLGAASISRKVNR